MEIKWKLNPSIMKLFQGFSFVFVCTFLFTVTLQAADDIISTTIVVIDGKALLVDVNEEGKILTTYMEVAEYFNNPKDHKTKVIEATANYTRLSKAEMDQIRFISLTDDGWDLDEFMVSNLADLAAHYQQTYANQIEITVARNKSNTAEIESNVKRITELLESYGVAKHDINIKYKVDLGEEPTRFIKVVSNLRSLVSK